MNQLTLRRTDDRGSVLISAAVAAAVIAILVGGMLTFISNEYRQNLRSHRWTQALYLAEAGVDIGFAEVNNYYLFGSNAFSSSRGWVSQGGGNYIKIVAAFTNAAGEVVGSLSNRVQGAIGNNPPIVKAFASCTTTPNGPKIYRGIKSILVDSAAFPAGLVSKGGIDMKGNNITTDSYDSYDVSKSTNGRYDSTKKQANGDIATNGALTNSNISAGNANISGYALTAPGGTVTLGASGTIGPTFISPATTVAEAQANGWVRDDFAVDIPDVTLPSGTSSWLSLGSINNNTTLATGNYQATDVTLTGWNSLVIDGDVKLYVTDASQGISILANAQITINSGGTLTIYSNGSMDIGGNGVVNYNTSGSSDSAAMHAQFYGMNTATSVNIHGNGEWVGMIYAPYADLSLGGGGEMSGSVVAKSINMNGHVSFHYDEALRTQGPGATFDIHSWETYRSTDGVNWTKDF